MDKTIVILKIVVSVFYVENRGCPVKIDIWSIHVIDFVFQSIVRHIVLE